MSEVIEEAYAGNIPLEEAREAVNETIAALDRGDIRVAEKVDGEWIVHSWIKEAILLYFRLQDMETFEVGPFEFHDKIPLKHNYRQANVRVVPPGVVRRGAFLEAGVMTSRTGIR